MSKRISQVAEKYRELQNKACEILSHADGKGSFLDDRWEKEIGYGHTRVLTDGAKIEKAAINFSHVSGRYSEKMAKAAGFGSDRFSATGVSSIIHPINPHVPIIHMNIRYFELDNGVSWFGGGIDLTPHYVDIQEASLFHKALKAVCEKYDSSFYPEFKINADEYFFIQHRNETRGVGGVFFDHLKPGEKYSFDTLFKFTSDLGELYPDLYQTFLNKKFDLNFSEKQKQWQYLRRGRYVEFNLVYDRGTKFGLESGGNTESILLSMPPFASWEYKNEPKEGSDEEKTLSLLRKGIEWTKLE